MSNASTIRYSSAAGVDWAALIAGLGLGLTVAMQVTTMTYSDVSSPYALITSFSRLCALVGTYFAIVGIFLVARIPFVERGVGHDRLVTWHRKLAPYSLFLIGFLLDKIKFLCTKSCGTCSQSFIGYGQHSADLS
jgi:hypothetical protein